MTCHKILKLEDMQTMTIDQIVNLYREGYNLEDSSIKVVQETPNMSIMVVLLLGLVSSFVGSYVYHTYYEKMQRSNQ